MAHFTKNIIHRAFPRISLYWDAFISLCVNKNSYLYSTGWMRSLQEGKPVNNNGLFVPWMNYPVIEFLETHLRKEMQLFEFGSGYSTLFYARLVKCIRSVETDDEWFKFVRNIVPENVELIHKEMDTDGEYCRAIHFSNQKYDLVIVDGRDRLNCLKQSVNALTDVGAILLDDSQREYYLEGINYIKAKGFRTLDFEGLKPTLPDTSRTTIFYRCDNCLNL